MSNRFSRSPNPQNDLFSSYNRSVSPSKSKNKPRNSPYSGYGAPSGPSYPYGPPPGSSDHLGANGGPGFTAYPGANGSSAFPSNGAARGGGYGNGGLDGGHGEFRSATPNSRGQYSAAVLDELESQNEEQVGVLTGKVKMLKDLTTAINAEIVSSSSLADTLNDSFENSRLRLRGTMNRMLSMAKKTGIGWRVWLGFFAAVALLFWWVWL